MKHANRCMCHVLLRLSGPGERQRLVLDGTGARRFPVEAMVAAFRDLSTGHERLKRLFPEDFVAPEGGQRAHTDALRPWSRESGRVARSFFLFNQVVGEGQRFTSTAAREAKKQFFGVDLHGLLNRHQPELEELGIRVFYTSIDLASLLQCKELDGGEMSIDISYYCSRRREWIIVVK